ncbi:trafficking protein particle complex subunit 3-like [Tropilaelaps mercedesae]|uniref:Trafficking protein particle complex subunit n=1 Tax=Tropilaelaps mercedesae TaxID=418985 RepID=A0A1V9XYF0_9ACAR|nr:trafficking protein particle complex subunit 3-like [Tropilaelaps mercedesae]
MSRQTNKLADSKKVNNELFTLTYGALVAQMLKDHENCEEVNKQLERMGYSIGQRLIEDFLARTNCARCADLRDTADKIQSAFKMYLTMSPSITNWSTSGDEFSLVFDSNPLTEFVELPDSYSTMLKYCSIIPGIIRGALEMVQMEVMCWFVQDTLRGDPSTELRIRMVKKMEDAIPVGEN